MNDVFDHVPLRDQISDELKPVFESTILCIECVETASFHLADNLSEVDRHSPSMLAYETAYSFAQLRDYLLIAEEAYQSVGEQFVLAHNEPIVFEFNCRQGNSWHGATLAGCRWLYEDLLLTIERWNRATKCFADNEAFRDWSKQASPEQFAKFMAKHVANVELPITDCSTGVHCFLWEFCTHNEAFGEEEDVTTLLLSLEREALAATKKAQASFDGTGEPTPISQRSRDALDFTKMRERMSFNDSDGSVNLDGNRYDVSPNAFTILKACWEKFPKRVFASHIDDSLRPKRIADSLQQPLKLVFRHERALGCWLELE